MSNEKVQKVKSCAGKENFERMNYLYQVSSLFAREDNKTLKAFSKQCSTLMTNISKKTVLRLEPKLKRKICKVCKSLLVSGETCRVKVSKKKIRYTCNTCKTVKTFATHRKYPCWLDKPDSVLEILDYSQNKATKQ